MRRVTLDFETRSEADLRKIGAWKYAADPTTDVMCLAWKVDDGRTWIWYPRHFAEMLPENHGLPQMHDASVHRLVMPNDNTFEAHNAEFERAIWHHIMHKRYGFAPLPLHKTYCTAAQASMHSLPRDLERAGRALGLSVEKDMDGHRLMMKMCKPRKARKAEVKALLEAGGSPEDTTFWWEEPEELVRLGEYCIADVETEHQLSKKMHQLPERERRIWVMDQKINQRGLPVDLDGLHGIIETIDTHSQKLKKEFKEITQLAPSQVAKVLGWMDTRGVELPNLQKQTVLEAMEEPLPTEVRRALEIRQSLGRSSTAKHEALVRMAGQDGRVRGTMMYHGAGTGRWSGKGFQPQNLYRGDFEDVDGAIDLMKKGALDELEFLYGDPMSVAATLVRPMIMARPGSDLLAADLSAIEGRGLAWIAGEEEILQAYRDGMDTYKLAAMQVYNKSYDDINKSERQIGKVIELACGYQGWVGAFQSMASTYGVKVADEEAARFIGAWRDNRQKTRDLWEGLEALAINAVEDPHKGATEGWGIKFKVHKGFLIMRLPSGRFLYYANPGTRFKEILTYGEDEDGNIIVTGRRMKKVITYWSMNQTNNKWELTDTYGGKLTENAVQALCRDILADAMLAIEENPASPYRIIMHVHDEIVTEVDEGKGSVEELEKIMSKPVKWAPDMPVAAEGWRGKRYRK